MPGNNLTAQSVTYNTSSPPLGAACLNGGWAISASTASLMGISASQGHIKAKVRRTGSADNVIPVGIAGAVYLNMLGGKGSANISVSGKTIVLTGTTDIFGGAVHELAISWGSQGYRLFVDGVLEAGNAETSPLVDLSQQFVIGALTGSGGFPFGGDVDEVVVSSLEIAGNYTPVTTATPNNLAGLIGLYHLDSSVADSSTASGTATAVSLALSSSSGLVGAPVTVTVSTDVALTGSQTESVALTCNVAGTFSPTSVTLNSSTATATATFTPSATGTGTITGTATGTPTLTAGAAPYTSLASTNNALTNGTANVRASSYNWNIGASSMKTVNTGAEFSINFTGNTCTLQFDISPDAAPLPKIEYQVDGVGGWITAVIAASVPITMPSNTTEWGAKGGHFLEVIVKATTQGQDRFGTTPAVLVSLTGIVLDTGATLTAPLAKPLKGIIYADSIGESTRTLSLTAGVSTDTDQGDARLSWAHRMGRSLNMELSMVCFGGQGWLTPGAGNVPVLGSSFTLNYAGSSRSFASPPDFIGIMMGTNDSGDVTTSATSFLNALALLVPRSTLIMVFCPLNGSHAAQLQAAIAATTTPSRFTYQSTTGWFNSTNSGDGLHPYGIENILHVEPAATAAVRAKLAPLRSGRSARSISLTLVDASGTPRASLSGLKWSLSDAEGVVTDSGLGATTDTNGLLSLSVYSTLTAGATAYRLWISNTDGTTTQNPAALEWAGPVVLT
jgi:hypothetical protein